MDDMGNMNRLPPPPDPHPSPGFPGPDRDSLVFKMLESAGTSLAQIVVLGAGFALAGYIYHKMYKTIVLQKMTRAFEPGDPVLDLAAIAKTEEDEPDSDSGFSTSANMQATDWVERPEQGRVDDIIAGRNTGHYHLIIGEKGTGKSSMILEAMRKINGRGVALMEAHADLEIFRIRLGKALDFEFHEDYIGGYFSERGPRETTALLDIERALNKLEKVALRHRKGQKPHATKSVPLVLVINSMHLIRDDDDGRNLLELLQQRAELWASTNLVTMVFNSDDYWVYERLKQLATRLEVTAVSDLSKPQAIEALRACRRKYYHHQHYRRQQQQRQEAAEAAAAVQTGKKMAAAVVVAAQEELTEKEEQEVARGICEQVYGLVGGRVSFLSRVAKCPDMLQACADIIEYEKQWFLNKCMILGREMDDDVMDEQKFAASGMTLARALVHLERFTPRASRSDPVSGSTALPSVRLHEAKQIMTRSDFIDQLDRLNIFAITSDAHVRASSLPMQHAFRDICSWEGFDDLLDGTIERIGDIESLGRTRELVAKDLVQGGKYEFSPPAARGTPYQLTLREKEESEPEENDKSAAEGNSK